MFFVFQSCYEINNEESHAIPEEEHGLARQTLKPCHNFPQIEKHSERSNDLLSSLCTDPPLFSSSGPFL